jgi:hypothetical protein
MFGVYIDKMKRFIYNMKTSSGSELIKAGHSRFHKGGIH